MMVATLWMGLAPSAASAALAWALSTWHSAALFAETGAVFHDMRGRVATLSACTERLAGEVEVLQLSESGKLEMRHLSLLHDNWKDVLLSELHGAEEEAEGAKRELAKARSKLEKL